MTRASTSVLSSANTTAPRGRNAFRLCIQQLMDIWLFPHSAVISTAAPGIGERASMDTCFHFSRVCAKEWSCRIIWPLRKLLKNCQAVFPSVLHSYLICTGSVPVCDHVNCGTRLTHKRVAASGRNFCIRNFPGLQPPCDAGENRALPCLELCHSVTVSGKSHC